MTGFELHQTHRYINKIKTDSIADRSKSEQEILKFATGCNQDFDERDTSHADEDKSSAPVLPSPLRSGFVGHRGRLWFVIFYSVTPRS